MRVTVKHFQEKAQRELAELTEKVSQAGQGKTHGTVGVERVFQCLLKPRRRPCTPRTVVICIWFHKY